MSDYELADAKEWDTTSSVRLTSPHVTDEIEDGFTTVQNAKAKRQNKALAGQATKNFAAVAVNTYKEARADPRSVPNGHGKPRGGLERGRGRGRGRGSGPGEHPKERPNDRAPLPDRSSTRRPEPQSAAELASRRGEPAGGEFSFTGSRKVCNSHLQTQSSSMRAELAKISRATSTFITESSADNFSVLIWGEHEQVQQALRHLLDLDSRIKPQKWAKNHAFDGRKENRRELKALEEEQATRLQLFAESQVYPFEYSFIWPDNELTLQHVIDAHEGPRGAFESLRSDHQCSIRYDPINSTIIIQGMQERDVTAAGRKFEAIARQMIAEMSHFIKISLVKAPPALLDKSIVSMDQEVGLKTALYHLPTSRAPKKDVFMVKTPKLLTPSPFTDEAARLRSEKMAKRLDRFNRDTILSGLERSLTNLNFVQKAVRMQVDFGHLAFLRYRTPEGSQHHTFESFRKTTSKDRTAILLQAMPPSLPIPIIIDRLRNHPTFKAENEILATVAESYVVAFEFRRPEGGDVLRHEQEFGDSAKQGEMEMKRKNWIRVSTDSDRTSPLILSMLDFEKLDWQLKIQAYDILDARFMPKEFAEFESRVGVGPAPAPAGITGPPMQRAVWPRGNRELVRVTNKPIIQFRLGRTDHVLEIAREDVYETDIFQSTLPQPESKWTASFYYSKWVNDLGEFAYNKPGERPLWESSLTTFFPEVEDSPGRSKRKHLKGPRNFLKEIEEVKDILWEVLKPDMDSETANSSMISERIGTLETQNDQDELFAG